MPFDKEHILDEIRRTAAANGGVPPGRKRFYSETGIRESDWLGVHWARWSEAISEAGLTANQFQSAYSSDLMLRKYAHLALELGRLPVNAELRMKCRNEPEFPAESTFRNRFVTKEKLIRELA